MAFALTLTDEEIESLEILVTRGVAEILMEDGMTPELISVTDKFFDAVNQSKKESI